MWKVRIGCENESAYGARDSVILLSSTGFCHTLSIRNAMSEQTVRIDRKEQSSERILDHLDSGKRVIVTVEALGIEREVTLRKNDGEYICDTGFKLMTYDDPQAMKKCIERLRLTSGN